MPANLTHSSAKALEVLAAANFDALRGNRCGHDPQNPQLSPPVPIKKGLGGLPRIISLAAEKAKSWFYLPQSCTLLNPNHDRQTRSERREACQVIIETLLKRMDIATLKIGLPTAAGFIDMDMKTIVQESGLGQRRCERAIGLLKNAGFIKVSQPRLKNAEGKYFALRAVRSFTEEFFKWLNLTSILAAERKRAWKNVKSKINSIIVKPIDNLVKTLVTRTSLDRAAQSKNKQVSSDIKKAWGSMWGEFVKNGLDASEAQRLTNNRFGYPLTGALAKAAHEAYSVY